MAKPISLFQYYAAAFNAKPFGMFVAPNWVALAIIGMIGLIDAELTLPVWLIGAGLEFAYLTLLAHNPRFRNIVNSRQDAQTDDESIARLQEALNALPSEDRARYQALAQKCRSIVVKPGEELPAPELIAQSQSLGRLTWIYLQLLQTRYTIRKTLLESQAEKVKMVGSSREADLQERILKLEAQKNDESLDEGIRKSYASQSEILKERVRTQQEAKTKLEFLEAELVRIQEQVELIREQSLLSAEPGEMADKIDQVTGMLESTSEWIREQQGIYGKVMDTLDSPSIVLVPQKGLAQKQ